MSTSAEDFLASFQPAKRRQYGSRTAGSQAPSLTFQDGESLLPQDRDIYDTIANAANAEGLDPSVLFALGHQESRYNPDAVGPQTKWGTAKGMFQLLDSTAKSMGIDPTDYRQAARATARMIREQADKGGLAWAIASHFGGTDKNKHGPKTRAYVREVLGKVRAIAKELGEDPSDISFGDVDKALEETAETDKSPEGFLASFGPAPKADFSGVTSTVSHKNTEESLQRTGERAVERAIKRGPFDVGNVDVNNPTLGQILKGTSNILLGPLQDAATRGWEGFKELINHDTKEVTLSDDELRAEWEDLRKKEKGMMFGVQTAPSRFEDYLQQQKSLGLNTRKVTQKTSAQDEAEWRDRIAKNPDDARFLPARLSHLRPKENTEALAPANTLKGAAQRFITTARNPLDLLLQDSLPANIISSLANAPEMERRKYDAARSTVRNLEVVSNPENYDASTVEQSQKELQTRSKNNPGIIESAKQLWQAAKDDPGTTGAGFLNALLADPELLFVPGGGAIKPLQSIRAARVYAAAAKAGEATVMTQASKATRIADAIMGYGSVEAALNASIGAAQNLAQTGEINQDEVKLNAALGLGLGGTLGAIFTRGARARSADLKKARADGTLDDILRDQAQADVAMEEVVRGIYDPEFGIGARQTAMQQRINELTGVSDRGHANTETTREDIKAAFKENPDLANHYQGVAEGRVNDRAFRADQASSQPSAAWDASQGIIGKTETELQQKLSELFGIKDKASADAWIAQRRREIRKLFKDESDYADYLKHVAEERVARAEAYREAAAAKQSRQAEEFQSAADAQRRTQIAEDFDAAIAARDAAAEAAKAGDIDKAWELHDAQENAQNVSDLMGGREILDSAYEGDWQAVKVAENKAKRRDSYLRTPKWQRGEVDPRVLATIGLGSAGFIAGSILADEDKKLQGGLLGGLTGLLLPAAMLVNRGSKVGASRGIHGQIGAVGDTRPTTVLQNMRKANAIDSEGRVTAALVKNGKLATKLEDAEIQARDKDWVELTRAGKDRGFEQLYKTYYNPITRYTKRVLESRGNLGRIDPEDVVQRTFMDFYNYLKNGGDVENVPAFLKRAAERKATSFHRADTARKRGSGDEVREGDITQYDDYEGDSSSAPNVFDQAVDSPDYSVGMEALDDTPEMEAIRRDTVDILRQAVERLPNRQREVVDLVHFQHYTIGEAAEKLGIDYKAAQASLSYAEKSIRESVASQRKSFEVRGPKNQRGSVDVEDLTKVGALSAALVGGATAGYFLSGENPYKAAQWGGVAALGALVLGSRTRGSGRTVATELIRGLDGRLADISPVLHGLAKKHGKDELQAIHRFNEATADFSDWLNSVSAGARPIIIEALSTRDKRIIDTTLRHYGGDGAVKAFEKVRRELDTLEDGLVNYGLISKSEVDYFPFRVKDIEGLKNKLKEMGRGEGFADELDAALAAAEKKKGEPLTDIEKDVVTNKVLEPYVGKKLGANTPGFAKARTIQRIDEQLQPFYYDPIETLNSYGVQANKYIQRAKFFGKDLRKVSKDGRQVVSVDESIGALINGMKERGELTKQKAFELGYLLRNRFGPAEEAASAPVQSLKNIGNSLLLSNVFSAAVQLSDGAMSFARYPADAVLAATRMAFRKKRLDISDFGLTDHIAHDFISTDWMSKLTKQSLKWGGFRAVDETMKNLIINTQVERLSRQAKSESGQAAIKAEFDRYLPGTADSAIKALQKGEINDAVELLAYTRLTDMQPLTAWELPAYYHNFGGKNKDLGRLLYHMQTYNMRVMNYMYEKAGRDMRSGDARKFARGVRNLLGITTVLGVAGAATDKLKDLISYALGMGENKEEITLKPEDIPLNMLKLLGMSQYDYQKMADDGLMEQLVKSKIPPVFRILDDVGERPDRAVKYTPVIGRPIYEYWKDHELFGMKSREEAKKENRERYGYRLNINIKPKDEQKGKSSRGDRGGRGGGRGR